MEVGGMQMIGKSMYDMSVGKFGFVGKKSKGSPKILASRGRDLGEFGHANMM